MSKRGRPRKFRATFENGGFWDYYKDLERQFEDFLKVVPYLDRNKRVCSFRLVNLLLSMGGHVDSAFKEMAKYRKFKFQDTKDKCKEIRQKIKNTRERVKKGKSPGDTVKIQECLSAFETEYQLSNRKVVFKRLPDRENVTPFKPHNPKTKAPKWWEVYNGLKHNFSNNFEKANLRVTRDALAGAFLLNVIHVPAALRLFQYHILEVGAHYEFQGKKVPPTSQMVESYIKTKKKFEGSVSTPIFIYDYNQ